jgi:hypothetical protein
MPDTHPDHYTQSVGVAVTKSDCYGYSHAQSVGVANAQSIPQSNTELPTLN